MACNGCAAIRAATNASIKVVTDAAKSVASVVTKKLQAPPVTKNMGR